MKIGLLGTGVVGITLGDALVGAGHEVRMGSRDATNPKARAWAGATADVASTGSFADAAGFGDVVFNCTAGVASLEALELAGRPNLAGKILIDVANPLDFSHGMPPTLTVCNTDSLGEQIQRALPDTRVVKTLNTVNCAVMVAPGLVPGDHVLFLCGDDPQAKTKVRDWLASWFGWKPRNLIDLGGISAARGTEMLLPLWIRLMQSLGTGEFNFELRVAPHASEEAA
ncbi:MAG: NADPH-dependent F420 reductase [Longimicrobiales bacterium]